MTNDTKPDVSITCNWCGIAASGSTHICHGRAPSPDDDALLEQERNLRLYSHTVRNCSDPFLRSGREEIATAIVKAAESLRTLRAQLADERRNHIEWVRAHQREVDRAHQARAKAEAALAAKQDQREISVRVFLSEHDEPTNVRWGVHGMPEEDERWVTGTLRYSPRPVAASPVAAKQDAEPDVRRDAERYRWLRGMRWKLAVWFDQAGHPVDEGLDAAIDASRKPGER